MPKMRPHNAAYHVLPFSSIYFLHFKGRKCKKGARIIFPRPVTLSSRRKKVGVNGIASFNSSIF